MCPPAKSVRLIFTHTLLPVHTPISMVAALLVDDYKISGKHSFFSSSSFDDGQHDNPGVPVELPLLLAISD